MWKFIKTWFPWLLIAAASAYLAIQLYSSLGIAVQHEWAGLTCPYALDYGEGQVLDQVNRLAHFQPIYFTSAATKTPPYTIANYPPLYQLVQVPFVWIFGIAFWYGRAISLLGVLAAALFLGLIIHTLTKNPLAGLVGGLTMLSMPQIIGWAPYVRVDAMALGLSFAGMFVVVRWPEGRKSLMIASALLVAAAYTKQSYALSAPLASFVWLLGHRQFRRALQMAGIVAGAGAVIFLILFLLTRGSFYFNIITATQSKFIWDTVRNTFDSLWGNLPWLMGACWLFFLLGFWGKIRPKTWWLVGAYLVGAYMETITIGKDGSSINYLYELSAAFGLVVGSILAWPGKRLRWVTAILIVLLATQISAMANWTRTDIATNVLGKVEHMDEIARLAQIVKDARGPVLADEYMGLIPLASQTVYMQPFEYKQLKDAGVWDDTPIANDIAAKKFPVILIYDPKNWDSFSERWTTLMRVEIETNYQETGRYADTIVYTPR